MTDVRDAYSEACKQATTNQGLDPVVERLTAEKIVHVVEQTGGFTMVLTTRVEGGVFGVTADSDDPKPYLVCFYAGDDWDQGEQEVEHWFGLSLDDVVARIRTRKPEPWCNHDPVAVVNGVCECGERVA